MAIIVSSFVGCGKEYFSNVYKDKVKIFDASSIDTNSFYNENLRSIDYNQYVDKIMENVDDNDIVFIPTDTMLLETLCERNIDFDIFYPSKERRGEFTINQVRKRTNPSIIREIDNNFDKWIDEIDSIESEHCYKHKLNNNSEFIGNDSTIMSYVNSLIK